MNRNGNEKCVKGTKPDKDQRTAEGNQWFYNTAKLNLEKNKHTTILAVKLSLKRDRVRCQRRQETKQKDNDI